jgi:hypothetical protein
MFQGFWMKYEEAFFFQTKGTAPSLTTTGVSQRWFSGLFRQVFFNINALLRINIGADVWG